jgi:AraC-like DNA-binding protein
VDRTREIRPAAPARGIVFSPKPDGHLARRRVLPSPALAPFVHHYWWLRWELRTPYTAEALPHPAGQIVVEREGGERRTTIAGVRTGRLTKTLEGAGDVFGMTFRPAMFQPILRAAMRSITDRVVPARDVLGADVDAWAVAMHTERELAPKMALAERFLLERLPRVPAKVAQLRDLVERMAVDRALLRVEDVAEAMGIDVRALQRRFRRYVGVTPKWVVRRYRLHEAAEQLRGAHPPTLAALAAELGYADQAHFARELKAAVGRTPGELAR